MNHYGTLAQRHWREWLPTRYAQLTDPTAFFTDLGQRVCDQVVELSEWIAGPDIPGEGYLGKVGRLNAARMQAEEMVLRDEVLLAPEKATSYDPDLEIEVEEISETDPDPAQMITVWGPDTEDLTGEQLARHFVP